ncbi:MAG: type II toxin-antitoxin system VapC family toxin [Candidatus Acidiferrum sp.]
MIRYLLDTNVVSELRKTRPHGAVASWLAGLRPEQICISAVTVGELQAGIEIARPQDTQKAESLAVWLDQIASSHEILPMDGLCFREWGRLKYRLSHTLLEDAMIAASARVHGLTVATRNERDFELFNVPILNPFRSS